MPKIIKFDLPIDGIRAKNIEEIRDHFTLEILAHFRSGLLAKWLAVRKLNTELEALQAIKDGADRVVFNQLCEVFAVKVDHSTIDLTRKHDLNVAQVTKQRADSDKNRGFEKASQAQSSTLKTLMVKLYKTAKNHHEDLGDGTVLSVRTNLQWMRCALGQTWAGNTCRGTARSYTWDEAKDAVAELNDNGGYAGYCDWRLPSIDELKTLVKKGKEPSIDQKAFPNTPSSFFGVGSPDNGAWKVSFSYGFYCYENYWNANGHVRLVRGGQ